MAPKILVQGELSKDKLPVDVTITLMATVCVFMLEYPTPLKNVLLFLQKCVVQIHDGKKLPPSVTTLVSELQLIGMLRNPS